MFVERDGMGFSFLFFLSIYEYPEEENQRDGGFERIYCTIGDVKCIDIVSSDHHIGSI